MKRKKEFRPQQKGPAVPPAIPADALWWPAWAVLAVLGGWIYWAGKSYFDIPSHQSAFLPAISATVETPFSKIFSTPLRLWATHLGGLAWLLLFLGSAYHLGDRILGKIGLRCSDPWLRLGFGAGLGLWILSSAAFVLAVFHVLRADLLLALQTALMAWAGLNLWRARQIPAENPPSGGFRKWALAEKLAFGVLAVLLITTACVSLLPEIFYDSLVYHLALPSLWLMRHSFVPLPFLAFSTMPSQTQLNYTWALAVGDFLPFLYGDTLAKLLHFSLGILSVLALYGYAKEKWGRFCAILIGVLYYSVPVIAMNCWTSGNDVGTGFFQTLGVLALFFWKEKADAPAAAVPPPAPDVSQRSWWILSAFFLGAAMASKYTAIFGVAATVLVAAVFEWRRKDRDLKSRSLSILAYGGVVLAVWSPWLIKNVVETGNPLHPFLFGYLGGQNISDLLQWQGGAKKVFFGAEFNILSFLRLDFLWRFLSSFWRVAMEGNDSVKYAGPVLLFFGPAVLFLRRWPAPIKIASWVFLLAYFFWFLGNEFARYLAPAYPCMALALAFAWTRVSDALPDPVRFAARLLPLGIALAVWSPLALIIHYTHRPWEVLTGQTSRAEFLGYSRSSYPNPSYKAYEYANQNLPKEGVKVLLLGDNKAYGLQRPFDYYTVEYNNPILQTWIKRSQDGEALYRMMRENGITHLIINYREFIRLHPYAWDERSKKILSEFWDAHVRALPYFAEGTYLYELKESDPSPAPLNVILEIDKRGWKAQSLMHVFMDARLWDNAIDEVESYARFGSPVQDLLANLYANRNRPGDLERAAQLYEVLLGRNPGDLNLYRRAISLRLKANQPREAQALVQRALLVNPKDKELQQLFIALAQPLR